MKRIPDFDDIVFEIRNREYGAYKLRKKYSRNVLLGTLMGIALLTTAVVAPYLNAKALESMKKRAEFQVAIKMENLDQPVQAPPPPPPPPPPPADAAAPLKYVAPVIVDSIKPEEERRMMTSDQAQVEVKNEEVTAVAEVQIEVKEQEAPVEVLYFVEEMPAFPGGDEAWQKFIYDHIEYPQIARENNIQGTVTLTFVVNYKGIVDNVKVLKGVDPALDNEAVRVVKSLPPWKPGKQSGKPVNVSFSFPVKFKLM